MHSMPSSRLTLAKRLGVWLQTTRVRRFAQVWALPLRSIARIVPVSPLRGIIGALLQSAELADKPRDGLNGLGVQLQGAQGQLLNAAIPDGLQERQFFVDGLGLRVVEEVANGHAEEAGECFEFGRAQVVAPAQLELVEVRGRDGQPALIPDAVGDLLQRLGPAAARMHRLEQVIEPLCQQTQRLLVLASVVVHRVVPPLPVVWDQ